MAAGNEDETSVQEAFKSSPLAVKLAVAWLVLVALIRLVMVEFHFDGRNGGLFGPLASIAEHLNQRDFEWVKLSNLLQQPVPIGAQTLTHGDFAWPQNTPMTRLRRLLVWRKKFWFGPHTPQGPLHHHVWRSRGAGRDGHGYVEELAVSAA